MSDDRIGKIRKTDDEWKALLSIEQYEVARCGGTEPPFSGQYNDHHEEGVYCCVCCKQDIFCSGSKFDSGSGWPSFWEPITEEAVTELKDISYGMVRTEILCRHCEAHLGHVFSDGPPPTGLRYCINSTSLEFVAQE